jgi:hypothetical protein
MSSELADIMNEASAEALESQAEINLRIKGKIENIAKKYIELNKKKKAIEKEIEPLKEDLKRYGDFETNEVKVKVSYGSDATKLKGLKDFEKQGFTEKMLKEKGLLTYYYTGDRLTVTDRTKKK